MSGRAARARRLAMVCYPSLGGSGVVATELALGLARRGHEVHVLTSGRLKRPLPECENLSLHEAHAPDYPLFEQPPHMLALASAIARLCQERAIDVLHVHYAVPHAASAYLARQLLGPRAPRLVTTLHGTDVTRVGVDPAYHALTRFCVESSDAISVPSAYLREAALTQLGIAQAHAVDVIPNCVDTERFAPPARRDPRHFDALFPAAESGALTLMHVSNFRAIKRSVELIDVLARARRLLPVRLVLVGDGPERAACQAHAAELGLSNATCFLGALSSFHEHLQHADGFLLTSDNESFGLAALEALSCGVPVFGYRVGGLPSVVTEDSGRLVAPLDRDALARVLCEVLRDPQLSAALGRAARARAVASFRLQPCLEQHERLYERVCAAPADPP